FLVPGEVEMMRVGDVPAAGGEPWTHHDPQAAAFGQVKPSLVGHREIYDRRDAAEQQLAIADLGRCELRARCYAIGHTTLVEPCHVHVAHAMLFADAAIRGFETGMTMDVD